MHKHVGMLRELADLAARELVIEQAVEGIQSSFMGCSLIFAPEETSGIPGRRLKS
jgi:hypothetical protein